MPDFTLVLADLVAIAVLTFAIYVPRHHRRDLAVSYVGVNVGVLAVATALADSEVGAGVGLGLFGVLSIIRLRSTELSQHEIAYYFSALSLGLLAGLGAASSALALGLMALVVVAMYVAGHPRLLRGHRQHVLVLDAAFTDERALLAELEHRLGGKVHQAIVQRVDLVNDTTWVDVRYEAPTVTVVRSEAPVAARVPELQL